MNKMITDQQLVDYILKLLPEDEQQALTERLEIDVALHERLSAWESVLFELYADVEDKIPPKRVWEQIEHQLFADEVGQKNHKTSPRFWHYLTPALLTFCLLFVVTFYWQHRPAYQATVLADSTPTTLWEIEGNNNSIQFTSISNMAMTNMECVAWLQHAQETPVRLGVIPDGGDKHSRRIELPKSLTVGAGDRIIIAMVARGETTLPTKDKQHIVALRAI